MNIKVMGLLFDVGCMFFFGFGIGNFVYIMVFSFLLIIMGDLVWWVIGVVVWFNEISFGFGIWCLRE